MSSSQSKYKAKPASRIHSTQVRTHQIRQRLDEWTFRWLYWQCNTCICTSFSFIFFPLWSSMQINVDEISFVNQKWSTRKKTRTEKGCRQNNNLSKKTLETKIKRKEKIDNDYPIWLQYACRRTHTYFSTIGFKIELMVFIGKNQLKLRKSHKAKLLNLMIIIN